ncbi:MAG: hypothetical protein NXH82_08165 [Rhodobacteraceae bacterium]|nr:hypothetical protein [Paracoccaceae bacterium]
MRVLHGDVSSTARALLAVRPDARGAVCAELFAEAREAGICQLRTGRPHAVFGNGTLMAAARRRALPAEPDFSDTEYCRCWMVVLQALIAGAAAPEASIPESDDQHHGFAFGGPPP